jgi:hypothetical protein
MSSLTPENGRSPENTPRTEGSKEEQGQGHLQLQTCEADGGSPREKRDYIIYIENSHKHIQPFLLQEIGTVEELTQKLCEKFPQFGNGSLGLRICDKQMGCMNRAVYTEMLPIHVDTLYISLYLKRHPPLHVS